MCIGQVGSSSPSIRVRRFLTMNPPKFTSRMSGSNAIPCIHVFCVDLLSNGEGLNEAIVN